LGGDGKTKIVDPSPARPARHRNKRAGRAFQRRFFIAQETSIPANSSVIGVGEEIRFDSKCGRPAPENILVRSKSRLRAIDSFVLSSKEAGARFEVESERDLVLRIESTVD